MIVNVILEKYENALDKIVCKHVWRDWEREDVKQDLALFMLEMSSRYDSEKGSVSTFVSANIEIFIKRFRREKAIELLRDGNNVPEGAYKIAVEDENLKFIDLSSVIEQISGMLREKSKPIFYMLCEGLSYKQIAKNRGTTSEQVRSHVRRYIRPVVERCCNCCI